MFRILLKKQNKTYKDENHSESEHSVSEFLFFDDFDIKRNKEGSQGEK